MEEQHLECEQQEKDDAKKAALYKQWAKHGRTIYGSRWQFLAPSKVKGYMNTATKYSSQVLTKSHPSVCSIGRLSHSSCDDDKVKRVHACKYLHLGSKHNALVKASKDYIQKSGGGLVQVNSFTDIICLCFFLIHFVNIYIYLLFFVLCLLDVFNSYTWPYFFHRGPRNGIPWLCYIRSFRQLMMSHWIIQLKTFKTNWLNF